MTTEIHAAETRTDAKNLLTLAGRMSIPADEAIRQIAQLVADADRPVTTSLRLCVSSPLDQSDTRLVADNGKTRRAARSCTPSAQRDAIPGLLAD